MKRLVLVLLVLAGFCVNANAQFFVSGTLGFNYRNDVFSMKVLPGVGYELNDRWAVAAEGGFSLYDGDFTGLLNPYVRFNFWTNDKLFLDAKAKSEIRFGDGFVNTFVGLAPSIRYAVNDHWQLSADMGALGVDISKYKHLDASIDPAIGLFINGVDLTVIYKF